MRPSFGLWGGRGLCIPVCQPWFQVRSMAPALTLYECVFLLKLLYIWTLCLCNSLYLLEEGQNRNQSSDRALYILVSHCPQKSFFLFFLYIKLFKLGIEIAFYNGSAVARNKVYLLKCCGSCFKPFCFVSLDLFWLVLSPLFPVPSPPVLFCCRFLETLFVATALLMILFWTSVTNLSLLFEFCAALMLSYRRLQMERWAAITVVAIPSQPAVLMWQYVSAAISWVLSPCASRALQQVGSLLIASCPCYLAAWLSAYSLPQPSPIVSFASMGFFGHSNTFPV